jgi:hypothetical protein
MSRALVLVLTLLGLAACQSAPPPAPEAKAIAIGDWTVRTSGYVRAEAGVVGR